jgi:four helix bundle protein
MKESVLSEKSFAFALRIVSLYKHLTTEHRDYVMSKQVLRSGTSIGANVEEAKHGQSKLDFIHKLSIAQKEASETRYWLRLLHRSEFLSEKLADSLIGDCDEIQRILTASIKTTKANLENEKTISK